MIFAFYHPFHVGVMFFYDKILQDKKGAVDQAPFSIYLMFGKRFFLNYLLLGTTRSMNGRGFPLVVLKE